MTDLVVYPGPWYCPSCGRTWRSTLQTRDGQPACPGSRCDGLLEPQGEGDDDPDALGAGKDSR